MGAMTAYDWVQREPLYGCFLRNKDVVAERVLETWGKARLVRVCIARGVQTPWTRDEWETWTRLRRKDGRGKKLRRPRANCAIRVVRRASTVTASAYVFAILLPDAASDRPEAQQIEALRFPTASAGRAALESLNFPMTFEGDAVPLLELPPNFGKPRRQPPIYPLRKRP